MSKLAFLNVVSKLSISTGDAHVAIKDIMRNDPSAGYWVFYTRPLPQLAPGDVTNVAASVPLIKVSPSVGSQLHVGKFSTPHLNDANTVSLTYTRVAGKFKIGRTPSDHDLMAQTVYGDPDRTTFPSVQEFAEKALTNVNARALLATTLGTYVVPAGALVAGVIIDQVAETIEILFSTTTQTQVGPIIAIVDLSDETTIHFAE